MYEHKRQPLASRQVFYYRILKNLLSASLVLLASLAIGLLGYKYFAGQEWIDALHNASMILSGMGPVFKHPSEHQRRGKDFFFLLCTI